MRKAVTMRKCKKDVAKKFTPQLSIYETISKFNGISVLKVGFQETDKSKEWFELEVIQGSF